MKEFQFAKKNRTANEAIVGLTSGTTMVVYFRQYDAPSRVADSSSSRGIESIT